MNDISAADLLELSAEEVEQGYKALISAKVSIAAKVAMCAQVVATLKEHIQQQVSDIT